MKKRYELVRYAAYNVTGMKLHLEKMARNGWLIDHINNNFWCYKKVEPMDITFTVSYFAKASDFDPEKSAGQETFEEMAAHDGWKLMVENAKLQIYANEDKDATPIYTDAESEVTAIIKSSKSFILTSILLFAVVALNLINLHSNLQSNAVRALADNTIIFVLFGVLILLLNMLIVIIRYYIWKHKALKAIEDDEFIPTAKSDFSFQTQIVVIALFIMISGFITSGNYTGVIVMVYMFFGIMIMHSLIDAFKNLLKKKKVDKDANLFFTVLVDILLATALVGGLTYYSFNIDMNDPVNSDEALISTGDFIDGESREMRIDYKESVFMRYNQAYAYGIINETFSYKVVDVKMESLEDYALEKMLHSYDDYGLTYDEEGRPIRGGNYQFEEIDASMFKADKAYQLWAYGEVRDEYLIKYGNRLVNVDFSWEIDEADIDKIIETFK